MNKHPLKTTVNHPGSSCPQIFSSWPKKYQLLIVYCTVNILLCIESLHQAINHWALLYLQEWGIWPLTLTSILFICIELCIFYAFSTTVTESICVHFLFILYYRTCIIERTVTSLLFHVPAFTLCLLVVRSTSPCRQDHERTNVCVCVCVKSPEEEWLVRPKYRETSSRFSLCCFVIYVYIFECSITGI